MAKRPSAEQREILTRWKAAPEADRRFIGTLGVIVKAVGGKTLHYLEPSTGLERELDTADRDTLFSLIAECLSRLLKSGVLERVRRSHRERKRRAARASKRRAARPAAPNPHPTLPLGGGGVLKASKKGKGGRAGGRRPTK